MTSEVVSEGFPSQPWMIPDEVEHCECCTCSDHEHWEEMMHQNDLDNCGECHACLKPIL